MRTAAGLESLDPTRGAVRVLRAVVVGAAAVVVSLLGHLAGPAAVPSGPTLAASIAGAALVTWVLSARRWTAASLTGLLLAAQSVLHLVFTVGAGESTGHHTEAMVGGHLVATLVTVVVLTRGESLLWAVVEGLSLRVWRRLRPVQMPPRPTVPRPTDRDLPAMPRSWHGGQPPRRGPPLPSRSVLVPA